MVEILTIILQLHLHEILRSHSRGSHVPDLTSPQANHHKTDMSKDLSNSSELSVNSRFTQEYMRRNSSSFNPYRSVLQIWHSTVAM